MCIRDRFNVGRVATAIAEQKKYVTSKQGPHQNKISLTEILPHDPYVKLNNTVVSYFFDQSHNENIVDEVFLRTHNMVEKVLQEIQVFDRRFVNDSTKNEGDTAIDIWKNQICCPTYGNLRAYLDQYSVFCGRNPLVGLCMWQQEHRLLLVYASLYIQAFENSKLISSDFSHVCKHWPNITYHQTTTTLAHSTCSPG